jgi:ABC-type phosphate transport system auxiliary subunit
MQQITVADPVAEKQRRERLHRLDALLEQLETLHMQDVKFLSEVAVERMREAGLALPGKGQVSVTAAIEAVWKAQEPFMLKGMDEKTKRKRRSKAEMADAAARTV